MADAGNERKDLEGSEKLPERLGKERKMHR